MGLPTSIIKEVAGTNAEGWASQSELNWVAEKTPLTYFPRDGVSRESSMVAITRSDTGEELGVVSPRYQIVQPHDILQGFESAVNNLGQGFKMDGIGLFDNGKIIWGRASSDVGIRIMGQDELASYLYMVTSFDGSVATMGFVSTLRTICSNALHLASNKGDKLFHLSHRSKYQGQAKSALDTYMKSVDDFSTKAHMLADKHVNAQGAIEYLTTLLYPNRKLDTLTSRELTTLRHYADASTSGPGSQLRSVGATEESISLWGLVNGVTYVVDNDPIRKSKDQLAAQKSIFMGAGNNLKNKAWDHALRMAA